jgi:uncharacterized protein YkwD
MVEADSRIVRRLPLFVLVLLTAGCVVAPGAPAASLLAPPSACPGQRDAGAPVAVQERAMRCMHDYARRQVGRTRLGRPASLGRSASRKSADILRCDEFSHTACGREFTYWIRRNGYGGRCFSAGENIAYGSGRYGTVRSIMRAWLGSPGHRQNILRRSFSDFGVGLRIGTLDENRGAHVWTAHFGDRC